MTLLRSHFWLLLSKAIVNYLAFLATFVVIFALFSLFLSIFRIEAYHLPSGVGTDWTPDYVG